MRRTAREYQVESGSDLGYTAPAPLGDGPTAADHTRRRDLRRPVDRLKLIHNHALAIRRVIHSRAYWGLGRAPRSAMDNVGNRIRELRENGDGRSAMEAGGAIVVLTEAQECIRTWTSG